MRKRREKRRVGVGLGGGQREGERMKNRVSGHDGRDRREEINTSKDVQMSYEAKNNQNT